MRCWLTRDILIGNVRKARGIFRLQTSDFWLRTSDFWHQISDFGLQTSDFTLQTSPRFLCRPMAFFFARAVGRQRALHNEYSGFASPTLSRHISTFCGYRILFSIRNPYINRFTNHFSIRSWPSDPQKVVLHSITARFCLRS